MADLQARRDRLAGHAVGIARLADGDVDDNDIRAILQTIVRRWPGTKPARYRSKAAERGGPVDLDHVVPVRVLVDRMIRRPEEAPELLATCVLLTRLTPEEHKQLGTMLQTHRALYERMQDCPIRELVTLGWQRYMRRGVSVVDADGRNFPIASR